MDEKARIYTYSIIYSAAEAFKDKTPYVVAVVEDSAGRRLARIDGYREGTPVAIGQEVRLVAEDAAGNAVYGF